MMRSPAPITRHRLLIIDDSLDFQLLVKTFLQGTNFLCISAPDGLQAMGTALREKPRVILLDIGLPGGDGLLVLERLRTNTHTQATPIIVVTGRTSLGLETNVRAKGAAAFLKKPIEKQILLETLQQVLQESALAPATDP